MRRHGLFGVNLVLLLPALAAGLVVSHRRAAGTHRADTAFSALQQPLAADTAKQTHGCDTKHKEPEPLNLILSPTAQQVSDENNKLLEDLEAGLHSLRNAYSTLTRLTRLLPEEEKQATFDVDKQPITIAEMLDGLNKLIVDGEKQQRVVVQGSSEILQKLATPKPPSQNTPTA